MLASADDTFFAIEIVFWLVAGPVALLATWLIGRGIQSRHIASLERREADVGRRILVTNGRNVPGAEAQSGELVTGSVVVGSDYFRRFVAGWRVIFGGRVGSLEPLLMRARREATLRMLEKADQLGANFVVNVRLETAVIGQTQNRNQQHAMVEVLAFGTAVRITHEPPPYGVAVDNVAN